MSKPRKKPTKPGSNSPRKAGGGKGKKPPSGPPKRPVSWSPSGSGGGFCVVYTNRWGKVMDARRYGYKAWPFGYRRA